VSKRQIIKTRPQRPYIVARIILVIVVLLALAFGAWSLLHGHPVHALALVEQTKVLGPTVARVAVAGTIVAGTTVVVPHGEQEGLSAGRMRPTRANLERSSA
jgi:hypothetical protein